MSHRVTIGHTSSSIYLVRMLDSCLYYSVVTKRHYTLVWGRRCLCCKDDDQSQWDEPKFNTPATPKPLNQSSPKFTYVIRSWISIILQNFTQIGWGVSFLRMRDFAHQIVYSTICSFFCFLGVLHLVYSQDARTDFDAKYVKGRGSAQGCAFGGRKTKS